MTPEEIVELHSLAGKAALPWSLAKNGMGRMFIRQRLPGRKADSDVAQYVDSDADAAYIVAAANAVPKLIEHIDDLQIELGRLKQETEAQQAELNQLRKEKMLLQATIDEANYGLKRYMLSVAARVALNYLAT